MGIWKEENFRLRVILCFLFWGFLLKDVVDVVEFNVLVRDVFLLLMWLRILMLKFNIFLEVVMINYFGFWVGLGFGYELCDVISFLIIFFIFFCLVLLIFLKIFLWYYFFSLWLDNRFFIIVFICVLVYFWICFFGEFLKCGKFVR